MKKRNYYILAVVIVILVAGISIFTANSGKISFEDAIWKNLDSNTITYVKISADSKGTQDAKEVTLTNKNEINQFINNTTDIEMKKTSKSPQEFNESYTITIGTTTDIKYGIRFYDNKYIEVHDYEAYPKDNTTLSYEILNDFDLNIIKNLIK